MIKATAESCCEEEEDAAARELSPACFRAQNNDPMEILVELVQCKKAATRNKQTNKIFLFPPILETGRSRLK